MQSNNVKIEQLPIQRFGLKFIRISEAGTDKEFFDWGCIIGIVFADEFEGHGRFWVDFDFKFGFLFGDAFVDSELAFGLESDFEFFG